MTWTGVTATVHRSGGNDRFDDPKPETTHTIEQVVFAPRSSSETADSSNTVITGGIIYFPAGDLLPTDELTIPGQPGRWAVEGDVGTWVDPWSGQVVGVQAAVAKASG